MCIRDRPWSAAAFALACRAFIDCVAEDGLHWARQDNDRDGCARYGWARMDEWRKHVQWQGDRIRTLEAQLTSPADERDARRRELELERRRTRALEERLQATQTACRGAPARRGGGRPPAGSTGSRRRSISPRTRPHCSGRRAVARSPRSNPATWPLRGCERDRPPTTAGLARTTITSEPEAPASHLVLDLDVRPVLDCRPVERHGGGLG